LGTRHRQTGQVKEVPRSSTSRTTIPARSALSWRAWSRWVRRHCRNRKFCTLPASCFGDALEVAHEQGTDPLLDGEGDYLPGGLVVGVVDAAAMARLDAAQAGSVVTPASGAALPRLWCSPGGHGAAGLLVLDVEVVLGAEGSPRHQQTRLLGDDRVGVDDAKVHPRHPARVQFVVLDGDGSGDRQPQPPAVG
jgi:hypothetical protein